MAIVNAFPFTVLNGTVGDANQVMADFNSIKSDVNANAVEKGDPSSVPPVFIGGVSGGSANAQTHNATFPDNFTLANAGAVVSSIAGFTNSASMTLNTNSTGVLSVQKISSGGLVNLNAGDVVTGGAYLYQFNGANYTLLNPSTGNGATGYFGVSSSTTLTADRAVVGAGSKTLQVSPVTIDHTTGEISGFAIKYNNQVGTTYTLQTTDTGKEITLNNGSAITVTLPNSLPAGFVCECCQLGAGQVTFTAAGGATLHNRQSQTKTAGQYAKISLEVTGNSGGSSAVYILAGDTA